MTTNIDTSAMNDEALGQHIEATVLDVASSATIHGEGLQRRMATASRNIPLTGLAPDMRDPILEKLKSVPLHMRASEERRLIDEAVNTYSMHYKVRAGISENANAYQREVFNLEREIEGLHREMDQVGKRLEEISHYDPNTGQPVLRLQGQARKETEAAYLLLGHTINLRDGSERAARLAKAKEQAIADYRKAEQARADAVEVERRAEQMVRDADIQRRADARAKWKTNNL